MSENKRNTGKTLVSFLSPKERDKVFSVFQSKSANGSRSYELLEIFKPNIVNIGLNLARRVYKDNFH